MEIIRLADDTWTVCRTFIDHLAVLVEFWSEIGIYATRWLGCLLRLDSLRSEMQ